MTIKIDSGIPVPVNEIPTEFPIRALLPKQSFFVPDGGWGERVGVKLAQALRGVTSRIGQENGQKGKRFAVRNVTENGQTGVRVWRTE